MSANPGARTWEMLRQQARASGHDVQALATNYVIERFIARLMVGNMDGAISVKGGQSLGILFGNLMRPTKDLDINFSITADKRGRNDRIISKIRAACERHSEDGITFDLDRIEIEFRRHQVEGGLRISVPASIHTSRVPFLIDVGIGNEMTFDPIRLELNGILHGRKSAPPPTSAIIYPMENTIAEKLASKFEDGSASIRHKDFFDLWLLIETLRRIGDFAILDGNASNDAEANELRSEVRTRLAAGTLLTMPERAISDDCKGRLSLALARTCGHRSATIPDDVYEFLTYEFSDDPIQSKQWVNWVKNNASKLRYGPPTSPGANGRASLAVLVENIGPFLEEIASAARDHLQAPRFGP